MKKIPKFRQGGVIFLVLALMLVVTGSTLVLGALNNRQSTIIAKRAEVLYQMQQIKSQLLAYAANYAILHDNERGPGFFPCPDDDDPAFDSTGAAEATCDSDTPIIGRLPQYDGNGSQIFRFNSTFAGTDEQFWLVVAPRYVYYSSNNSRRRSYFRTFADSSIATEASQYWLSLDGETEYVALIIAPGEELETQDRAGGRTDYANYLDGQNGGDAFNFYTNYDANPAQFNDVVLGITLDEFMVHTGTAVARAMKDVLDEYNQLNGNYPGSNSSSISYLPSGTCGSANFGNAFESGFYTNTHNWLRDNTSGNGNTNERWSCRYGTFWTRLSGGDSGELKFPGCANLTFTLVFNGGITRTGDGC